MYLERESLLWDQCVAPCWSILRERAAAGGDGEMLLGVEMPRGQGGWQGGMPHSCITPQSMIKTRWSPCLLV